MEYPTILRRYISSFIDGCLIIVSVILVPYVIADEENTLNVRIILAVIFLFVYKRIMMNNNVFKGEKIEKKLE